jgi:hypothetical protein
VRHDPGVLRLQVINSTDYLTSLVIFWWVQSPSFSLRALHSSYSSSYMWLEGRLAIWGTRDPALIGCGTHTYGPSCVVRINPEDTTMTILERRW